jgi:hypothetical protein
VHVGGGDRKIGHGISQLIQCGISMCPACQKPLNQCKEIKMLQSNQVQERWDNLVAEGIKKYPAIALELSKEQLSTINVRHYSGLTEHQKKACRLAGRLSEWHPQYVAEMCLAKRPPLFKSISSRRDDLEWDAIAQRWQTEHDTPVNELAQEWAKEMKSGNIFRLLEPISWKDNVRISAHDQTDTKMPCHPSKW